MGGRGDRFLRRSSHRLGDALALISTGALFAAPTPSVNLETMLAPPPTAGYVRDTSSNAVPAGDFDATRYATYVAAGNLTLASKLSQDGFAGGFGASWTEQSSGHGLVELVVAFAGGRGARSWLATAKAIAIAGDHYQGPIAAFGIGQFYGARYADPAGPSYSDVVSFIKGNDFFTVRFTSGADDLGNLAAEQAKRQSDYAPSDSIPPSQWPENVRLLAGGIDALRLAAVAVVAIAVLGLLFSVAVFFYVRGEESATADAKLTLDGKSQPPDG